MFGLASRTKHIRVELQACNRRAQVFPDGAGARPRGRAITRGAPVMRGRAPFARLLAAARVSGLPARLSRDAGSYLCNYAYWRALETAARPSGPRVIAFVHVPRLRIRTARAGRSAAPTLDQLLRAAQAIVVAVTAATKPGR